MESVERSDIRIRPSIALRAESPRWFSGVALALVAVVGAGVAGCASLPRGLINGLLNPQDVGSYGVLGHEGTLDIRSSLTLEDAPSGVLGYADPQPEDLVPVVTEYEYGIGDALSIRVFELLQQGTETAVQVTIDEAGSIAIPVLGRIEVAGLTLPEIEAQLVDELRRQHVLVDPEVMVEPTVRRGLSYSVYGSVALPNLYPLGQYNLKLLEAISIAGGLLDSVTEIYVVRGREPAAHLPAPAPSETGPASNASLALGVQLSDGFRDGESVLKPVSSAPAAATRAASSVQPVGPGGTPATPSVPRWVYKNGEWVELPPSESPAPDPSGSPSAGIRRARAELMDTMIGEPPTTVPDRDAPSAAPRQADAPPVAPSPAQPRWIYKNGRWVETRQAGPPSSTAPTAPRPHPARPQRVPPPGGEPAIDWARVAGFDEQRVIKVSASALREGDPRQNIVIRPGDMVRVVAGEFGEYYIMGEVLRPGAYSLTGRSITLKSAVASAGNLAPLAWPNHCTVYRRLGDREQMIQVNLDAIFAGKEQDFFLKRDDLVLVGTHPVAPFLAVLRNAFRVSYGFGFVYDRNFADIDSFGAQPNPAFRQPRFPNLFQ